MNKTLLEIIEQITEEEQKILAGQHEVEKIRYTSAKEFVIDSKRMLEAGELIRVRNHTRFIRFPLHKHNYIEVMYVCQGSITHIIEGKELVLQAGELLFLNQHTKHELLPAGEGDIGVNFIVLPEFFDVAFSMIGKDNLLADFLVNILRQDTCKGQYLYFKVAEHFQIQNLIENMIYALLFKEKEDERVTQTTMGLLFLHLLNAVKDAEHSYGDAYENQMILFTLKYIDLNYRTGSLTELCIQLKQPMPTLSRLIKRHSGSTFKELLQKKRMHKAVELLIETNLSVNDIITAVGYENNSYFHRKFKEQYGMTPKAYRLLKEKVYVN